MRSLFADRRFWLLALLSLAVLLVGRVLVPATLAMWWVKQWGYWITFAMVAATTAALWSLSRTWTREDWRPWLNWKCWGLVLLATTIWHGHENHGFKILADEALLLGTSQHLHLEREAGYGIRATDVRGPFEIIEVLMDKRPLLFPFVVSLAHDLTGYRVTNPFWVNTVLGAVFLALAIGLGRQITGSMSGGLVSALWWMGVPLLAQQAAGGGFELLNLCLLTAWVWLAMLYAERAETRTQDAFVLVAVLLGSTRYESLLYLAPTALLLILVWVRAGRVLFSPLTWIAPVFLLPVFWLNQAFDVNEAFWQMKSKGAEAPFGLEYLPDNLGHALAHFLSLDGFQPNSVGFGLLGLLALPFLMLWVLRRVRAWREVEGAEIGLFCGLIGLLGGTGVMMVYFWGQFDDPIIHRLSLPTQLLMMIALLVVATRLFKPGPQVWRVLGGAAAMTLLVWSLPSLSRSAYTQSYAPGLAYAWRLEIIDQLESRNILVIDRDSFFWVANGFSATPNKQAQLRKEGIAFHFRHRSFDEIYVVQNVKVDPITARSSVVAEDDLGPGYRIEQITEHRLSILQHIRLSRVVGIEEDTKGEDLTPAADTRLRAAETEELDRSEFEREWIRNLP